MNATDAPGFVPSAIESAPAELVQLNITNVGAFNHTFTLSQTPNATIARNATPQQLYAFFNHVGTMANVSIAPGATVRLNLTMPAANVRQGFFFASVVPFQFQAGMSGWLNVTPRPSGAPVVLSVDTAGAGFTFVPNVLAVSNSSLPVAVAVQVGNLGTQIHTWTLSSFPNYNMSSSNYSQFLAAHPPLANTNVPTSPGQVIWANFTITTKGVYQFICTIPGHFANGMYGYLYVGVAPPAVVSPPSTEIVQLYVLIGAGAILGVGVVIAVVSALSGRMQPSPAPPKH
jgi:uncharacterized cupredoxin-like copper-binding protein